MELMYRVPPRTAFAVTGSVDASKRFRTRLLQRCLTARATSVVLIEDSSAVVGFAEMSTVGDVPPLRLVAECTVHATGYAGAITSLWRSRALLGVAVSVPKGGLHLVELQVAPDRRNRGFGARLLDAVEHEAHRSGAGHISLTTAIENPARRLYDRHGFSVVEEKRSASYERMTGSPGRVLMIKQLQGAQDEHPNT